MTDHPVLAPVLLSGLYVRLGAGVRIHVAATPAAGSTECGRPLTGYAEQHQATDSHIMLDDICRRCAERHLALALALGLVVTHG